MNIAFKRLPGGSGLPLPAYQTQGSAGMDLYAAIEAARAIAPGARQFLPCGFSLAIPEGYEGQVRSRSGLALKHGISVLNSPGTIDSDYRGEVGVVLVNHGSEPFVVSRGMRIAQLVISAVEQAEWTEVDDLPDTDRGSGGYGHTGGGV
ncbi:MAG: dUTP diphosphatase [Vicinamibacteria bacterium]|nr:dUTP diphosphatase [Vicinamibacteria bacterium]